MNIVHHGDNLTAMRQMKDKQFTFAIVDPPYGINAEQGTNRASRKQFADREYGWDSGIPEKEYFDQLFRVSEYQIIWGANYFLDYLGNSKSFITWDKLNPDRCFGDCEWAWCSNNFDLVPRVFKEKRVQELNKYDGGKVHPTQKPVALYHWTIQKFCEVVIAKVKKEEGIELKRSILDTHIGSGSIRIAADLLGYDLEGYERDDYFFNEQEKRYSDFRQKHSLVLDTVIADKNKKSWLDS